MERSGFKVDIDALDKIGDGYKLEIASLLDKICELAGEKFNPSSPKQLSYVLFEKLGLKAGKKSKTGAYSTNAEQLEGAL